MNVHVDVHVCVFNVFFFCAEIKVKVFFYTFYRFSAVFVLCIIFLFLLWHELKKASFSNEAYVNEFAFSIKIILIVDCMFRI